MFIYKYYIYFSVFWKKFVIFSPNKLGNLLEFFSSVRSTNFAIKEKSPIFYNLKNEKKKPPCNI